MRVKQSEETERKQGGAQEGHRPLNLQEQTKESNEVKTKWMVSRSVSQTLRRGEGET